MNDDFSPLVPDLSKSTRFSSPSTSAGPTADGGCGGFEALLPMEPVPPPAARVEPAPARATAAHERLPVITLKRDGNRITRIQVRCSCGETIELDCVY